jgi:hypothetical protein
VMAQLEEAAKVEFSYGNWAYRRNYLA